LAETLIDFETQEKQCRSLKMLKRQTALYYPHISLENEALLKNALLLWDNVDIICPFDSFPRLPEAAELHDAFSLIARPLKPTPEQMQSAHEAIIAVANSNLPNWFFPENVPKDFRYSLHPEKFLPKTWNMLRDTRLAQSAISDIEPPMPREVIRKLAEKDRKRVFETTQAFGLTMLSILANCCAGTTKELITDEIDSYAAYDRYIKFKKHSLPITRNASDHDRLTTISLSTLDLSKVPLSRLVRLREKEPTQPALRAMRHAYTEKLGSYVDRLRQEAKSTSDIAEIERLFKQEISDDIGMLREELKEDAKHLFFSKELAIAVVALAGTIIEPISSKLITAGSLEKARLSFSSTRRKTLAKHPSSWLYQLKRFPLW
jgi:hypothetical protein